MMSLTRSSSGRPRAGAAVRRRRAVSPSFAIAALAGGTAATAAPPAEYVVHISVDGLRTGDATQNLQGLIAAGRAPTFARLQQEAAWTHDARTDTTYVYTLPNHTSMMTGRPADDAYGPKTGHHYRYNTDPEDDPIPNNNLHENAAVFTLDPNIYIAGTFDVAHDNGLRTALYTGKDKFIVFDNSWDADSGRPDATGPADNGRDKIDVYRNSDDNLDGINNTPALVGHLIGELTGSQPLNYAFLHLEDPDAAGHATAWGSPEYLAAIERVDEQIGRIIDAVEGDPDLAGRTTLVITADHGGGGNGTTPNQHGDPLAPEDFTIPFYVWGAGVQPSDLYALNAGARLDPSALLNPPYALADLQPIRNGDSGNLALDLLGLGPIPGSSINAAQDLNVPEPASCGLIALGAGWVLTRRRKAGRAPAR